MWLIKITCWIKRILTLYTNANYDKSTIDAIGEFRLSVTLPFSRRSIEVKFLDLQIILLFKAFKLNV